MGGYEVQGGQGHFGRLSHVVRKALGKEPHSEPGQGEEGRHGGTRPLVLTDLRAQHGLGIHRYRASSCSKLFLSK